MHETVDRPLISNGTKICFVEQESNSLHSDVTGSICQWWRTGLLQGGACQAGALLPPSERSPPGASSGEAASGDGAGQQTRPAGLPLPG